MNEKPHCWYIRSYSLRLTIFFFLICQISVINFILENSNLSPLRFESYKYHDKNVFGFDADFLKTLTWLHVPKTLKEVHFTSTWRNSASPWSLKWDLLRAHEVLCIILYSYKMAYRFKIFDLIVFNFAYYLRVFQVKNYCVFMLVNFFFLYYQRNLLNCLLLISIFYFFIYLIFLAGKKNWTFFCNTLDDGWNESSNCHLILLFNLHFNILFYLNPFNFN